MSGRLELRDGRAYFVQREAQGNGILHTLREAALLADLPAGSPPLAAGAEVDAYQLF